MNGDPTIEELIKEYRIYSEGKGFKLNPDQKVLMVVLRGLLNNEEKYGKRYCPCRRVKGVYEKDSGNVCPCAYHLEEIKKNGRCLCGLFVK